MKKPSVSVGIPAYNEELNIKLLVEVILKQKNSNHVLKEVVVVSDFSSDNTVRQVKKIKDPRVKVVDRKIRMGLNRTQNEILGLVSGDILVLMDADVVPLGLDFINEIVAPIINDENVGVVGADVVSAKSASFFEKIIADSHDFKYSFYKRINRGNNIYVCHGRASAFPKRFYSKLRWPIYPAEDAYAYLACLKSGYRFEFAPNAKVLFRSPSNLSDHIKQSQRFFGERMNMAKYFEGEFVKSEYRIPVYQMARSILLGLFRNPLTTIIFLMIATYIKLFYTKKFRENFYWNPSVSTKKVI